MELTKFKSLDFEIDNEGKILLKLSLKQGVTAKGISSCINSEECNIDELKEGYDKLCFIYDKSIKIPRTLLQQGVKSKQWVNVQDINKATHVFIAEDIENKVNSYNYETIFKNEMYNIYDKDSLIKKLNHYNYSGWIKNFNLLSHLKPDDKVFVKEFSFKTFFNTSESGYIDRVRIFDKEIQNYNLHSQSKLNNLLKDLQTKWTSEDYDTVESLLQSNDVENHILAVALIHSGSVLLNMPIYYNLFLKYSDKLDKVDILKGVQGVYIRETMRLHSYLNVTLANKIEHVPYYLQNLERHNHTSDEDIKWISDAITSQIFRNINGTENFNISITYTPPHVFDDTDEDPILELEDESSR